MNDEVASTCELQWMKGELGADFVCCCLLTHALHSKSFSAWDTFALLEILWSDTWVEPTEPGYDAKKKAAEIAVFTAWRVVLLTYPLLLCCYSYNICIYSIFMYVVCLYSIFLPGTAWKWHKCQHRRVRKEHITKHSRKWGYLHSHTQFIRFSVDLFIYFCAVK